MANHRLERTQSDLTEFMLRHRQKLTPADVGLPTSGRRRTPGLRREEVAALAGVGLTWYTWFEQGRDIKVSERFLLNLSRALKLDDAECCHLFLLAHRRAPPAEAYQEQSTSPRIQSLMDDLSRPSYVMNLRWDAIGWNAQADELLQFSSREASERNLLRMVFTAPDLRRRLPDWQQDASNMLAQFRCDLAVAPKDPVMQTQIEELCQLSPDFRHWWEASSMEGYNRGISSLLDTEGEHHTYTHETLIVDEHRHLKMVVYFAAEE
ncbi:helix-turn-helix transcriptional regulator [Halomonas venusta]|uniref:helix-turn-helix transcriptional regulator n=1 Tax=Vreelandella venusta TaxID=44935 RepID=UPI00295E9EAB|nr:helix-turn-helix transcriptional regulator [Halomonas venusta]MDW0358359.1 helix-turn-helix transcriptional regulator [Halomonas venusta]